MRIKYFREYDFESRYIERVPNDDDSMNRRKIERVDENILTTYSRKFRGGILPQEDRREKCAK